MGAKWQNPALTHAGSTESISALWSCDQLSTLIPGRSRVFQKFDMEKGKCSFQKGKSLFLQTEVLGWGFFPEHL